MEHLEQIKRAIDYIENSIHEELSIEEIAKVAAFSRWHFQIIFSATVGETVKDYIRKRRLTEALQILCSTNQKILEIALHSGFESQESFTRAFKNMFGVNPGECRKIGPENFMIFNKPKITMEYLNHLYEGVLMEPIFKKMPEFKVVGVGSSFISILSPEKNNHMVIPKLWDAFFQREDEIISRIEKRALGICMPIERNDEKAHPDECFYLACAEVSEVEKIPEGMVVKIIPGGEYAIFTHRGSLDKLTHTMDYIYGVWLSRSGRKLREAPDLELYDERFHPDSPESEIDIYIPIEHM